MGFGGSSAGNQATDLYNQQQATIQSGLQSINNTFSGFTSSFYNQRAQDYVNYAIPQAQQQFQQNKQGLNYGLSNQGLLNSSAAQNLNSKLGQQYTLAQQGIANTGQQQAQQLQQNVEGTRAQLINQLTSSANPSSVAQGTLNAATQYSAPSAFSPVGNLFSQWGNIYAANALTQPNNTGGSNPFSFFSGTNNRGSGTVAPTTLGGG